MKVTETHVQAVLMTYLMNQKHHDCVIPNSDSFFRWEADLISITKAGLVHEFEIKLNMADYKRDAKKWKHTWIGKPKNSPAYFWYATFEFDITPPENNGWVLIKRKQGKYGWVFSVEIKKDAPRLSSWKPSQDKITQALRLMSWRLTNIYHRDYLSKVDGD